MGSLATYSCVSLPGTNLMSKVDADATGYRRLILGGFDISNRAGIYYPLTEGVKSLFAPGGSVRRRIDSGLLKGEIDHPQLGNLTHDEILHRLAIIEPTLVSHHIKQVELVSKKDDTGKDIVVAYGWVKPSGPYGPSLEASLSNPEENVAFSVRSFCQMEMKAGRIQRLINDILTWDHVSEGGIKVANKFDTVCLESLFADITFTPDDFAFAIARNNKVVGLESNTEVLRMVRDNLGWHQVKTRTISSLDW